MTPTDGAWALVLVLVVFLLWRTISGVEKRSSVGEPVPLRAIDRRVVQVGRKFEIELELSNGSRFRTKHGYVWFRFPSGERVEYPHSDFLENENARLGNLDRWSHADEKDGAE